jgi:dihydrodipicolinate synthase/N-acetylneuraminate lyase
MMRVSDIDKDILSVFRRGAVIPAQPLALDAKRKFNPVRQRALTRYYIDAGAGGIAVGVHSTQFEIRDPKHGLFEPVLSETSRFIDGHCARRGRKILKVSGVCGKTPQALKEAEFARKAGYHACLLSLAALKTETDDQMAAHCREVSKVMPIIGFYLQTSVGGRPLPYSFWRKFAEIDNVLGIKMAPFNRYQTFDVVRAVCDADRENDITLYTGNDDNIAVDLLTEYTVKSPSGLKKVRIKGGLLGHWCVWTKKAVELLDETRKITESGAPVPQSMLTKAVQITDCNAALFDAANHFEGCIPGIHEALRRQGLLEGTWCLNPDEVLSPGQAEELTRVHDAYPGLNDDDFVAQHLDEWLRD